MGDLREMDEITATQDDARATMFFEHQNKLWEGQERKQQTDVRNAAFKVPSPDFSATIYAPCIYWHL